ncbi:hypothetical protein [Paucibacter sp. KBW04]|uniref:hypothetical protein n=1 Tax=Paucibacter sp. KBW04 TaxID=2153361 RepID=UPI001E43432A|nr:hypothetical protein [Paucibacter sp. KBW04]
MRLSPSVLLLSTCSLVLIAGCATPEAGGAKPGTEARVTDAVTAPLQDLNLVKTKIPEILQHAHEAPYRLPGDGACAALNTELAALEQALGPDIDSPARKEQLDLLAKGGAAAGDAAFGALRSASENLLPFRGWVRKLTGAERHSGEVTAALVAGQSRRAFLRGVHQGKACP